MTHQHGGVPPMDEVFFALCKSLDTPVSLGAWLRYRYSHIDLANMEISPESYLDARSFRDDYLVVSYLSKYKGLNTGLDLEAEALRKFASSEASCALTNQRIRLSRNSLLKEGLSSIIPMAKRKIAWLLGPFDREKLEPGYGWGPGATDDVSRRRAFLDIKMHELPISVTRRALPWLREVLRKDLHWSSVVLGVPPEDISGVFSFLPHVFAISECCVIDTVTKNAKTHRVIAKEPRGNAFLQKGPGWFFRQRLKRVRIDLDDQGANQRGAHRAFWDGLATLDLKQASDSNAVEVPFELLPLDWAEALNDLRSHRAALPNGDEITLQKFSSMGNGFTFELETIIFWAITSSVVDLSLQGGTVLVYGDDIICPRECAPAVIEALGFFGFQVNKSKSFIDGNFFESCGKHYFQGEDVTPIYQKECIEDGTSLIRCGNRLMRCAARFAQWEALYGPPFRAWQAAWRNRDRYFVRCNPRKGNGKYGEVKTRFSVPSSHFYLPLGADGDDGWLLRAEDYPIAVQDKNLGLRCRVFSPSKRALPALDEAFLAYSHRLSLGTGGVSLPVFCDPTAPFEGVVEPENKDDDGSPFFVMGYRWVMPGGEFGL